jgi:hypothetical protein
MSSQTRFALPPLTSMLLRSVRDTGTRVRRLNVEHLKVCVSVGKLKIRPVLTLVMAENYVYLLRHVSNYVPFSVTAFAFAAHCVPCSKGGRLSSRCHNTGWLEYVKSVLASLSVAIPLTHVYSSRGNTVPGDGDWSMAYISLSFPWSPGCLPCLWIWIDFLCNSVEDTRF